MATAENRLTDWLRDAEAMEKQATTMLDALAKGIENYPDVKAQIERHLQEARDRQPQRRGMESGAVKAGQVGKNRLDNVSLWGRVSAARS